MLLNILIATVGLLLHFSMKWKRYRDDVEPVGLKAYLAEVPAQTLISVLATVGVFAVALEMELMNAGLAFASGYMGHSLAENFASRFAKV